MRRPRRVPTAAALCALLLAGACSTHPTAPTRTPAATVHRTVTALITNSLGAPVPDVLVTWISRFDSAGSATVLVGISDDDGESRVVLAEGGWIVTTGLVGTSVAGSSLLVAGASRAAADTQLVRLALQAASHVSGQVTLAGRTEHGGTIVFAGIGEPVSTSGSGAWSMDGVPPGTWPFTASHLGFREGISQFTVPRPGSDVRAPSLTLPSEP